MAPLRCLVLLLAITPACALTERCDDVSPATRLTDLRLHGSVMLLVHNPRDHALSATLDCTGCGYGIRARVELAPREHTALMLPLTREGCACALVHDVADAGVLQ